MHPNQNDIHISMSQTNHQLASFTPALHRHHTQDWAATDNKHQPANSRHRTTLRPPRAAATQDRVRNKVTHNNQVIHSSRHLADIPLRGTHRTNRPADILNQRALNKPADILNRVALNKLAGTHNQQALNKLADILNQLALNKLVFHKRKHLDPQIRSRRPPRLVTQI